MLSLGLCVLWLYVALYNRCSLDLIHLEGVKVFLMPDLGQNVGVPLQDSIEQVIVRLAFPLLYLARQFCLLVVHFDVALTLCGWSSRTVSHKLA